MEPMTLFHVLRSIFSTEPSASGVRAERRRQAKALLAEGCRLLQERCVEEADIQFAAAMSVDDDLLIFLAKRKRRELKSFISQIGGGIEAQKILLQLERLDRLQPLEIFKFRIRYRLHNLLTTREN